MSPGTGATGVTTGVQVSKRSERRVRRVFTEEVPESTVLPSTREHPEGSVRVEVQVPSWESLSNCVESDTQASGGARGARPRLQVFISDEFVTTDFPVTVLY